MEKEFEESVNRRTDNTMAKKVTKLNTKNIYITKLLFTTHY
jgi:hypothetical protein